MIDHAKDGVRAADVDADRIVLSVVLGLHCH
jgi:hypothetical protein